MQYELITSNYEIQMNEVVNKRLSEGWELYGELKVVGVFPYESGVSGIEPIFHYAQVMIKREAGERAAQAVNALGQLMKEHAEGKPSAADEIDKLV